MIEFVVLVMKEATDPLSIFCPALARGLKSWNFVGSTLHTSHSRAIDVLNNHWPVSQYIFLVWNIMVHGCILLDTILSASDEKDKHLMDEIKSNIRFVLPD